MMVGWIPEFLGLLNPVNETWLWIAQILEFENAFEMISNLNQFPGNQTWKIPFFNFPWAFD